MSWPSNSPARLGHTEFFQKYVPLAAQRFEKYFPGQWGLTKRLEALGELIAAGEVADPANLMLFLIGVAVWKEPYERQAKDMIVHVTGNSYEEILSAFSRTRDALSKRLDRDALDAIASLKGLGITGGRKVASAVLRFLDPRHFAVVDYKNWTILSNTAGQYFARPILAPLAPTIEATKDAPIDTTKYLQYLHAIRTLADESGLTPADVDMALFAYSDEIRPLTVTMAERRDVQTGVEAVGDAREEIKHHKMVEIIMRVVNDNKRKGHGRAAQTLESALRKCRTPAQILSMCYNMTTRAAYMDLALAAAGTLTLRQIMSELERIYRGD